MFQASYVSLASTLSILIGVEMEELIMAGQMLSNDFKCRLIMINP
jgi:hypothetical protein